MSAERLLKALDAGRRPFGLIVRSADPAIVEIAAIAGYDWVSINLEHSALTIREVTVLQRAADARGISTLVHFAEVNDHRMLALLDEGIGGIVAPHITQRSEAEALVRTAKFPPVGHRGANGITVRSDYGAKPYGPYVIEADRNVAVGVNIEDKEGVENAEDILSVPGLRITFIGLHDLSTSLGHAGEFTHPEVREAVTHIIAAAHKNGIAVNLSEKSFTIQEICELGADMIIPAPMAEYAALLDTLTLEVARARAAAA